MKLSFEVDLSKLAPKLRKKLLAVIAECADQAPADVATTDAPPPQCGPGETCP